MGLLQQTWPLNKGLYEENEQNQFTESAEHAQRQESAAKGA